MSKLITVKRAEEEVKRLQDYLDLVIDYPVDTIEKWVIREYAYTNSMVKVVKHAREQSITKDGIPVDREFVLSIINGDPKNDGLHKLLKAGYKSKIRSSQKSKFSYRY